MAYTGSHILHVYSYGRSPHQIVQFQKVMPPSTRLTGQMDPFGALSDKRGGPTDRSDVCSVKAASHLRIYGRKLLTWKEGNV